MTRNSLLKLFGFAEILSVFGCPAAFLTNKLWVLNHVFEMRKVGFQDAKIVEIAEMVLVPDMWKSELRHTEFLLFGLWVLRQNLNFYYIIGAC